MKNILLLLSFLLFTVNCSNNDDEPNTSPFIEADYINTDLVGTWKHKHGGLNATDATITFSVTQTSSSTSNGTLTNIKDPRVDLKINSYSYSGKLYYSKSGDGALYFKLNGKNDYSKLTWKANPISNNYMQFKIENVESFVIYEQFQKQ